MVERIKANGRSLLRPSVSGVEYLRKKDMMLRCQMQGDPVTNLKTLLYNVQLLPGDVRDCESHLPASMELKSGRSNLDETFDTGYKSYIDDDILLKQPFQNLLRRQDEYIEQLEKENGILKREIDNLIIKVREVIAENHNLINVQKTNLLSSALSSDTKAPMAMKGLSDEEKMVQDRENMVIASYHEKIKSLTEELSKVRCELLNAIKEIEELKSTRSGKTIITDDDSFIVSNLKTENKNLVERIIKLEETIAKMKVREEDAQRHIQSNICLIERTHFEKIQALMESDNLRKDLEQQQKLIREMNKEHEKRVETEHQRALECHQASCEITERKYANLLSNLASVEANLEMVRRENKDLKFELQKTKHQLDIFRNVKIPVSSDIVTGKLPLEFKTVIQNVDQEENVSTSDLDQQMEPRHRHVSTYEKDNQVGIVKELFQVMQLMENKYDLRLKELEKFIEIQITMMDHFKTECQRLSGKMNNITEEYNHEIVQPHQQLLSSHRASNNLGTPSTSYKERHVEMAKQLQEMEQQIEAQNLTVNELLNRQTSLLREGQFLRQEVVFLKNKFISQTL